MQGMKNKKISQLRCGDKARIVSFESASNRIYRSHLLAMGLTPGTTFALSRMAPLGDPIEIMVRGYTLSLRKAEAAILNIEHIL
jgi:ferrous iron transport protein A